jgi:hypothetical protein
MICDAEQSILARLVAECAPGSVLLGTFDPADLTDDSLVPVLGKIMLTSIANAASDAGQSCRLSVAYSFSVYTDVYRATTDQKSAAAQLLQDAGNALVGWSSAPGRVTQIIDGPESGFDGRVLRLSFGFTIPAFFAGT